MAAAGRAGARGLALEIRWVVEDLTGGFLVATIHGNLVVDVGVQELAKLFAGAGGTAYNNLVQIGVGNGTTAPHRGQTGLLGSNQLFKAMNPGYPQIASDGVTVTYQSTFGPEEANFNWQEFGLRNSAGVLFNRRTQNVGTKSGGSWRVNLIVRFASAT